MFANRIHLGKVKSVDEVLKSINKVAEAPKIEDTPAPTTEVKPTETTTNATEIKPETVTAKTDKTIKISISCTCGEKCQCEKNGKTT